MRFNKKDEQLFKENCVVNNGTLDIRRLHVSQKCIPVLKDLIYAYVDAGCDLHNGNREKIICDFARHASRICCQDNRKTILASEHHNDIVAANAFIHKEDYLHEYV